MSEQSVSLTPETALKRFFERLSERDRNWLCSICAGQTEGPKVAYRAGCDGAQWLDQFLSAELDYAMLFGRIVWLVALLDIELSDLSAARANARALVMSANEDESARFMGDAIQHELLPTLQRLIPAWEDVRRHELDFAALMIGHEEAKRRASRF